VVWAYERMKVNWQSAALRLVAIGFAALLVVLLLSSIQAIAKINLINIPTADVHPHGNLAKFPPLPNLREFPDPLAADWQQIPFPAASRRQPAPAETAASSQPIASQSRASQPRSSQINSPQQEFASADPSNFGDRVAKDVYGHAVYNKPLVVLHETVGSADSALNTFRAPHSNEDDQVSYHSLIRRNGTIIYVVSPEKRAFGAGNSAFKGAKGIEAVKTHRLYPSSVNNFAYHISLESPKDGANSAVAHSGYTNEQYRSLAWLVAQTRIPDERITTHRGVDRSGSRIDPRSFDGNKFFELLHQYPRPDSAHR
jgi:N-acetylmuramoyl-L-alanine amidase